MDKSTRTLLWIAGGAALLYLLMGKHAGAGGTGGGATGSTGGGSMPSTGGGSMPSTGGGTGTGVSPCPLGMSGSCPEGQVLQCTTPLLITGGQ